MEQDGIMRKSLMTMKQPEKFHQPCSDDDLIMILSDAPARANAIEHAARFQRTSEAID
jgi:hypothetical protein